QDPRRFGIAGPLGYYDYSAPASFNVNGRPIADFFAVNSELHGVTTTASSSFSPDTITSTRG
ncbi:MAG: hypothetical protein ACREH9_06420, partial [Pseudomonadota bacterium]